MPRLTRSLPKYRHHKASGQAVVTLDGRDHYLGAHESETSRLEYDRHIAEWLAAGRRTPSATPEAAGATTVAEVLAAFWAHAETYYRGPDGTPTGESDNFRLAMAPVRRLFGRLPASEFGPLRLKAVRQTMVDLKWSRTHVNRQVSRVKHVFKWAVENELVPSSVHHGLLAVAGLKAGRCEAPEAEPVRPVDEAVVETTLRHLSPTVAAMVRLQLLTGMRPGEVCAMRRRDIDERATVWVYRPAHHKTEHHGHHREVRLGPRARLVIAPYLTDDSDAHLFSPSQAERQRLDALHAGRKTPMSCGNVPGSNRRSRPKRTSGDQYDVDAFRRAIARACARAFPPPAPLAREPKETLAKWRARLTPKQQTELLSWRDSHNWHPHQLRHTAATRLRREYGLEAAQVILGHKTLAVTQIYAEKNVEAAVRIMAEVG
ncbi:MAG: tyrosine-type recombinase/integrase [Phycisphaerae bacterium]|nr:site-specific integrase [Tepidisphaeraceae bacterium]